MFNCLKASIGASQAHRFLHVSKGGFQNVGCTLMDMKNYYHDLRSRIKDADAHMFVFLCFEVDAQGRLMCVLNLKERRMPCPHVCGST
jgi:hypothetical protein